SANPCMMCMPMGAATALSGLRGCMAILHGSQGCATYIRRHMATHYNEPIDIASSSLTEQGTVFGGEKNLAKGLSNLIKLYDPELIGVCSTCLAETIGEDLDGIIKRYQTANPDLKAKIIAIASPGYGGGLHEGFFRALKSVLEQTCDLDCETGTLGTHINIVTPFISPGDMRWLKSFLASFGLDFIFFPDLSENLDGGAGKSYERLKKSGTSIENIKKMANASATLEFSEFVPKGDSPGEHLLNRFHVPLIRLPLPTGIRAMDTLVQTLVKLGGIASPEIAKERGRYLDAMVDSHKHCGRVKAAVYGEPDFVKAMVSLCCESGMVPVVAATGSVCPSLHELKNSMDEAAQNAFAGETQLKDDADFTKIEEMCLLHGANLMIGNSDGRRISSKLAIDLIRRGFPIHDRVGGQRTRFLGFDGSLSVLDEAANSIMGKEERSFRMEITRSHFGTIKKAKPEKKALHPCFSGCEGQQVARIHLPVAPNCNIQCRYCLRKFDCVNESRPGVASSVISPREALDRYLDLKSKIENLKVVGIAGPGDPLANFDKVAQTIELIKERDPEAIFCLSTNGLTLPVYAKRLIELGVTHFTVTMNTINPSVGAKIISHADYMGERFTGEAAASILLSSQFSGIKMLADAGAQVKVNCVAIKGVNDSDLEAVSKKAAELGACLVNVMPHIPVKDSEFESISRLTKEELETARTKCEKHAPQMRHCRQCRADAAGLLGQDVPQELFLKRVEKMKVAVASKSGTLVDQHFGHAEEFLVFETDGETVIFLEKRKTAKYCNGECDESDKWAPVVKALSGCQVLLALRIGPVPEERLKKEGIRSVMTFGPIEEEILKISAMDTLAKSL
ncbi:MAG: radical SAM protein, partial [Clostridiales bacterium]|nr:radical SAM protein [Clostridiales bacterium]